MSQLSKQLEKLYRDLGKESDHCVDCKHCEFGIGNCPYLKAESIKVRIISEDVA